MNGNQIIDILNRRYDALVIEKDPYAFFKLESGYIEFLEKSESLIAAIESLALRDRLWNKALIHFVCIYSSRNGSNFVLPKFISKKLKSKYYFPENPSYYQKSEDDRIKRDLSFRSSSLDFSANPVLETSRSLIQQFHLALLEELNNYKSKAKFDSDESILYINNSEIIISKSKDSNPHYLLKTLFKNPKHNWSFDEIAEDWGSEDFDKESWKKYNNAALAANRIIAIKTQIPDFIKTSTKNFKINSKYL